MDQPRPRDRGVEIIDEINELEDRLRALKAEFETLCPGSEEQIEKTEAASTLGRYGGQAGGHARAAKLSPERRREIAQLAARKRWGKPARSQSRLTQYQSPKLHHKPE